MKVIKITIKPEAIGIRAMLLAREAYNPLKEPEKYKKYYMKIFRLLKKQQKLL